MSSNYIILSGNQSLRGARTASSRRGPQPLTRASGRASRGHARRALGDVITRARASLGFSGAGAFASTGAVSGALPLVARGAACRAVGRPWSHRLSISVTARWQQAWPLPRGASFSSGPCPGRAASRRVLRLLAEAAPEAAAARLRVVREAVAEPRGSKTFVSTRR